MVLQGDGIRNKAPSCLQVRSAECMRDSVGRGKKRKHS